MVVVVVTLLECYSSLFALKGILTATAPPEEGSSQWTVQRHRRSTNCSQSNTHSRSPSIEPQENWAVFIHLHMTRETDAEPAGNNTLAADQSSIASSWSAKSSNMLPMSSKMETVVLLLGGEQGDGRQGEGRV